MGADAGSVLVADDDRGVRESVVEILESAGYTVVTAYDGEDALVQLEHNAVDAVLLDVRMPRLDGLSVIEEMAPVPPPPSVVVVTAYDVEPEVQVQLGPRVLRFLRKPVPPLTLLQVVADAVRAGQAARRS